MSRTEDAVAIIGLSGRFPGAPDPETFWENLRAGEEAIHRFSDPELRRAGVDEDSLRHPRYVKARAAIFDADRFAARFFGYSPREAKRMDPQQRLFLECAWEGLERSGYDAERFAGSIGVFAGSNRNSYAANLRALLSSASGIETALSTDTDYLATRTSYHLDLRGPSVGIQTACSTGLVAVHQACASLLSHQCDMALAGGASITVPGRVGYLYRPHGIASPDGHCRAFDAKAQGTVSGDAVALVVLRRLTDALADRDLIHAVILGSAINNDGATKSSIFAPSIEGQAQVIDRALADAGVAPDSIQYIEAHGTGTEHGDPVELAALTRVFATSSCEPRFKPKSDLEPQSIAIGSVKTNVGHSGAAAGIVGLIKALLCVRHGELVPSLHFETPNPELELDSGPFYVSDRLQSWTTPSGAPRRAGVSSFGVGGTNAHLVLEEAPARLPSGASREWQILPLSAKTTHALDSSARSLSLHLGHHPGLSLADTAYTLQVGRREHRQRRAILCRDVSEAVEVLDGSGRGHSCTGSAGSARSHAPRPVFLFPGQGSQHRSMSARLYESEPTYRTVVDDCCEVLRAPLGLDLREKLFGEAPAPAASEPSNLEYTELNETWLAQPALFTVELALARLWMSWGVLPEALLGHSIGEYVAACLSGVFELEDALQLVATRGRLAQDAPPGAMLAVALAEDAARPFLAEKLWLSAVNGPAMSVISGAAPAVAELEETLRSRGISSRRLHTSHAFHSGLMDGMVEALVDAVGQVELHAPKIPLLSNVSGGWMTEAEATDPTYWGRQLRETVRFRDCLDLLIDEASQVFLEVGPGNHLATLLRTNTAARGDTSPAIVSTFDHPLAGSDDGECLAHALAQLWVAGVEVDWTGYSEGEQRNRVELPTYPFERESYWIDALGGIDTPEEERSGGALPAARGAAPGPAAGHDDVDVSRWLYVPIWKQLAPRSAPVSPPTSVAASPTPTAPMAPSSLTSHATGVSKPVRSESPMEPERSPSWLIFCDDCGLGEELANRLSERSQVPILVSAGSRFCEFGPERFEIDPLALADYHQLAQSLRGHSLRGQGWQPQHIVHCWTVTGPAGKMANTQSSGEEAPLPRALGFYSVLRILQAFALGAASRSQPDPGKGLLSLSVLSDGVHSITGNEVTCPDKAMLSALCRVVPQEYAQLRSRHIDVDWPSLSRQQQRRQLQGLDAELQNPSSHDALAYRGPQRWAQHLEPSALEATASRPSRLREGGVYLLTGGLGQLGLALAAALAKTPGVKLALLGRTALPPREHWSEALATQAAESLTCRRIRALLELDAMGAELLLVQADVADEAQLRKAVAQVEQHFGPLHGVIHAAGVTSGASFTPIALLDETDCQEQFRPKVAGSQALARVLLERPLDFCHFTSSLSTLVGGPGMAAYAAANAFMDSLCQHHWDSGLESWLSVDWDRWGSFDGLSEGTDSTRPGEPSHISPAAGQRAFEALLSYPATARIAVATESLEFRLGASAATGLRDPSPALGPAPALSDSLASGRPPGAGTQETIPSEARREYLLPPRDAREALVCEIWQELLGVAPIGVHDDFFELGGQSLLAVEVILQLGDRLGIKLSVRDFFVAPTPAELAERVREAQQELGKAQQETPEPEMPDEALSDEEVEALLALERSKLSS